MSETDLMLLDRAVANPTGLARGIVKELLSSGEILVEIQQIQPLRMLCDYLQTARTSDLALNIGDAVLVLPAASLDDKGCVLGRIGPYRRPDPQRVVIEAEREVVLKCGDGSLTLNHEGKVLTKGVDVVSHAKRKNRIRGGSVQIN